MVVIHKIYHPPEEERSRIIEMHGNDYTGYISLMNRIGDCLDQHLFKDEQGRLYEAVNIKTFDLSEFSVDEKTGDCIVIARRLQFVWNYRAVS